MVADGTQVEEVLELTGGHGAEVVVDFVGEGGATAEGVAMLRQAGDYHVVGYGENIDVPTIDIISAEINIIGNLVGSYNDLCDLMALAARGAGHPAHREVRRWTTSRRRSTTSTPAGSAAAPSSSPERGADPPETDISRWFSPRLAAWGTHGDEQRRGAHASALGMLGVLWAPLACFVAGLAGHGDWFEPLVDGWFSNCEDRAAGTAAAGPWAAAWSVPSRANVSWRCSALGALAVERSGGLNHHARGRVRTGRCRSRPGATLGYLAFPVLVLVSLVSPHPSRATPALQARRLARRRRSARFGACTLVAALVGPLVSDSGGASKVAVAAAYPLVDLMLLAVASGITVARGFRPLPVCSWLLAAGGLLRLHRRRRGSTRCASRTARYVVRARCFDALWSLGLTAHRDRRAEHPVGGGPPVPPASCGS